MSHESIKSFLILKYGSMFNAYSIWLKNKKQLTREESDFICEYFIYPKDQAIRDFDEAKMVGENNEN